MQKTFRQLVEEAKNVRLREEEKFFIKNELLAFMVHHPISLVRMAALGRPHYQWSNVFSNLKQLTLKPMPIIIILVLLLGGGTSVAAQNALPGDALYPIKIHINESVRGALAVSSEAKANWEASVAIRRLEEAEKLAVESDLSADARSQIEDNFLKFANRSEARVQTFKDKDSGKAADAYNKFETALRAHERILLNIGTVQGKQEKSEINALIAKVRNEANENEDNRITEESEISENANSDSESGSANGGGGGVNVETAAQGRMKAAENKIAETEKFIDNKSDKLGATSTVEARAHLKVAQNLFLEGKAKLDAKVYDQSFVLFGKAMSAAQSVKLFIQAKIDFEEKDENDDGGQSTPSNSGSSISNPDSQTNVDFEDRDRVDNDDRGSVNGGGNSRIRINIGI